MKRLILVSLFLVGCASQKVIDQHTLVINAITDYVSKCQEVGALPKPDDLDKQIKEKGEK